jgi:hypothetical protein
MGSTEKVDCGAFGEAWTNVMRDVPEAFLDLTVVRFTHYQVC